MGDTNVKFNMNTLALMVAEDESKKKEVNIAQIKEVLKVTSMLMVEYPEFIAAMIKSGAKNL